MKKSIAKILSLLFVTGSFAGFGACTFDDGIDKNKTQIYVSMQECGVGYTFLDSAKMKYEALNPKVQIIPVPEGAEGGEEVTAEIQNGGYDIYFTCNFQLNNYVNIHQGTSEYFADITDIVTKDDEDSLHAKMFENVRDYYNIGNDEKPQYFALPWYTAYNGTVYDVDLFENYHLFSTDAKSVLIYEGIDGVTGTADDNWGPDGREETFDDGLPGTYEDLKQLWLEMKGQGITPYSWTSFPGYASGWLATVWASYEGDNFELLKSFDGMYYSSDAEPLKIDNSNGYLVAFQNGKKAALQVAEDIIRGGYYLTRSLNTSQDNGLAQIDYLKSIESESPIAFLFEGTWWENEAKKTFEEMEEFIDEKYAYGTRRFGLMPFPRFIGTPGIPDQVNQSVTYLNGGVTSTVPVMLVNKHSANLKLAKDFVKFMYSDAMNADFTKEAGVSRPFYYKMEEEQLSELTYFQQQLYQISQDTEIKLVAGLNRTDYSLQEPEFIADITRFNAEITGVGKVTNPFLEFHNNSSLTVADYMTAVGKLVTESIWEDAFVK